ncbi:MAG: hypothetical protein NC307_10060 [Roseburia sp.]|nr:hypothetical protein [Roseburia sp.]
MEIFLDSQSHTVKKEELFFVDGMIPHSIWNHGSETAKVITYLCCVKDNSISSLKLACSICLKLALCIKPILDYTLYIPSADEKEWRSKNERY